MRNPFRQPGLRTQFEVMVEAYKNRHPDLLRADGTRCRGNSLATMFWRGFDNVKLGSRMLNWDRASKNSFGYACFCAGQAVALSEKEA